MRASSFITSKYLSAADFSERPVIWTIAKCGTAILGGRQDQTEKPVLALRDADGHLIQKRLVLNVGNLKRLTSVLGDNMDEWAGAPVKLWVEWTEYAGERVKGIRIATAATEVVQDRPRSGGGGSGGGSGGGGVAARRPVRDDLDDDIPFVTCDPAAEPYLKRRGVA